MTRRLRTLAITMVAVLIMAGCQEVSTRIELTGFKSIADFATIESYYHNVAEIKNDGTNYIFGLLNVGYKKAWFEYDGVIRLGIDAKKVKVSGPDDNGQITVTMPEAKVIGTPLIDEKAASEIYTEKGLFTQITLNDQREALEVAQQKMLESAEADTELLGRAKQRAQALIEQYIKNVGQARGESFTVVFN